MIPRLCGNRLWNESLGVWTGWLWNLVIVLAVVTLLGGYNQGREYAELVWPLDVGVLVLLLLSGLNVFMTVARRREKKLYVSVWYVLAAMVWFPIIFATANLPVFGGVEQAAVNWWYGHNALGLFITPLALAAAYYFIPKVLGRPIQSYSLSLVGFWALAFFYSLNGIHHLIGGPLPAWLITTSITASVMMVIPVAATAVNFHTTMVGRFGALQYSPSLRFVVAGSMIYTAVSLQGSVEALRGFNRIVHFTHYTVGHAHLGVYGFASLILFGALYFIIPRLVDWEWPSDKLIRWHFWLALAGVLIYVVSLTVGGWLQGQATLDAARPFMDSVNLTKPYLVARSVGGTLMLAANVIFAWHYWLAVRRRGKERLEPAWSEARR